MVLINRLIKKIFGIGREEHGPDQSFVFALGAIVVFGLLILSSASAVAAYTKFGSSYHYFNRQIVYLILGVAIFWFFSKVDYHVWKKYAVTCLLVSVGLLLLVFLPSLAVEYGSARSWIDIFGFTFQPSEFVKIFFLIYLASWLDKKRDSHNPGKGTAPFFFALGLISLLMVMQPDIGTLSIIAISSLATFFISGEKIAHILAVIVLGIFLLFILVKIYPYQMDRFKCLMDSSYSTDKECYQLDQSLIAVGSGGFWGRGLGQSRQKFMYLPEVSSDSIFAIMAEEIGFFFSSAFVILYFFIFYRGAIIAKRAPDVFGRILATGIIAWIMIQTCFNIGGIIGIVPMTGVPLPLVSHGGSSLISVLIAFGILVNISKHTVRGRGR